MPHGTISPKCERSVLTLRANPWLVTQREIRTPMAASFSSPTQMPVRPGIRAAVIPKSDDGLDEHFLEIAHVAVHVAAFFRAAR